MTRVALTVCSLLDYGQDNTYGVDVEVGTPPQKLNLILDTGSSETYIFGSNCKDSYCQQGNTLFDASKSSSYTSLGTDAVLQYGKGNVNGTWVNEVVAVGGNANPKQTIAVIDSVVDGGTNTTYSGLIGLGPVGAEIEGGGPTFWKYFQSSWATKVFTVSLARAPADVNVGDTNPGGTLTLGGYEDGTTEASYTWMDVNLDDRWSCKLDGMTVNDKKIDPKGATAAFVDTGNTLLYAPAALIAEIYAGVPFTIPASGDLQDLVVFDCDGNNPLDTVKSKLGSVALTFGGKDFTIAPEDLLRVAVSETQCVGTIGPLTINYPGVDWVIGDVFMKNVVTAFKLEPLQIGFSDGKPAGGNTSTTATTSEPIGGTTTSAPIGGTTTSAPIETTTSAPANGMTSEPIGGTATSAPIETATSAPGNGTTSEHIVGGTTTTPAAPGTTTTKKACKPKNRHRQH